MVKANGRIKDGKVYILNLESKLREAAYMFKDGEIEVEFRKKGKEKTTDQMAYFWGEVAVKLYVGLCDLGFELSCKEAAVEYMKSQLGFTEKIKNNFGEIICEIPKSLATSKKHEISSFTDQLIKFVVSDLMLEVKTPKEYKKSRKWK